MAHLLKVYFTEHSTGNVFRDEANFYRIKFKILQVICKKTKISMSYYEKKEITNGARIHRKSKGYKPQTI
jgi:hypothetical protein